MDTKKLNQLKNNVRGTFAYYFKKNGKPYDLTPGQVEIVMSIIDMYLSWVWINAPSRYGKTEVAALTLLFLARFGYLKIPVVAGSADKANKIMEYIVEHISDHPDLSKGLINKEITNIERLKVKVTQTALRWSQGGWIYITSIDSRSKLKEGEGAVGEGGDIVFLEEAGLIRDESQFSKVLRMPEGKTYAKLVMSGNAFENSIFHKASEDPKYTHIQVTLEQAFAEGRLDRKRIMEDVKPQMTTRDWLRFYECRFPTGSDHSYFQPRHYDILPLDYQMWYYGAIDPSLGEKKNANDTKQSLVGIAVIGVDKVTKQMYEVYSEGEIIKPNEAITRVINLPYKFVRFVVEEVQFQKYFKDVLDAESKVHQRYIPFAGIRQSKAKIERIESLEPYVNTGQILFRGGNELAKELKDYPMSEYLDVMDALEMAVRTAIGGAGTLPKGQSQNTKQGVGANWRDEKS